MRIINRPGTSVITFPEEKYEIYVSGKKIILVFNSEKDTRYIFGPYETEEEAKQEFDRVVLQNVNSDVWDFRKPEEVQINHPSYYTKEWENLLKQQERFTQKLTSDQIIEKLINEAEYSPSSCCKLH